VSARAVRLAALAALVAVVPALVSGCGRRKASRASAPVAAASGSATVVDEDDPTASPIAEIDLSRGAPEARGSGLLQSERATYFELVEAVERLHQDDDVKGVFIRFGSARIGWSRVEEVARGLHQLREAGKTIYCHADDLGNATYWLAAEGCSRVFVSPAGSVATVGIAAELMFAHDLLTKVGVDADILQIGKFKGANETMMRSSASEESRQSIGGVLTDLRARWLSGVQTGRGRHDLVRGLEAGPHAPGEARASGLIDEVGYEVDARRALKAKVGRGHTENVFGGPGAPHGGGGGLIDLVRTLTGARRKGRAGGSSHVAVLRASGAITMERGSGLGGQDGIDARTITKQIRALARDDSARAVVLRIDSPGGSALASDLIWHELMELRKKKPIVVSIGDMAASGGYYLACAGTKIVAEESSIVGSIGVVGGKLSFGRALREVGVNTESISADPAASGKPPYLSPFSPWDEATRGRVRATMQDVYDLFVRRVAEGRGVPVEKVATFAEGRIWSGREGRALGMVDTWGGLSDAIDLARKEAKLDVGVDVRLVGRDHDFFDVFGLDDDDAAALTPRPQGFLGVLAASPDAEPLLAFASSVAPLATGERALVAMPFAFLVRLRRPGGVGAAPPWKANVRAQFERSEPARRG
jgi:protease-4